MQYIESILITGAEMDRSVNDMMVKTTVLLTRRDGSDKN